jgi:hypothetical protein
MIRSQSHEKTRCFPPFPMRLAALLYAPSCVWIINLIFLFWGEMTAIYICNLMTASSRAITQGTKWQLLPLHRMTALQLHPTPPLSSPHTIKTQRQQLTTAISLKYAIPSSPRARCNFVVLNGWCLMWLRLSSTRHVEYCKQPNVSANSRVSIIRDTAHGSVRYD